jgi:hypothetical protein
MKKRILIAALLTLLALPVMAQDYLMRLKEYTVSERCLSVGVASWTDSKHDLTVAGYFNYAFVAFFEDHLRFGAGMMGGWDADEGRPLMRLQTSVTSRIFDYVEVGVWMAPFWDLYGKHPDDPYGMMVGYVFKF